MNFLSWFKNRLSNRYRARSHYRQGMKNARVHQHQQAVIDYTSVIEMQEAPADIKAMALYNRALVLDAMGDQVQAVTDLNKVLAMMETPEQVRLEARRKITRMGRSNERSKASNS
jgi:tetratricopeptide (TPR) repeat protein